MPEDQQNPQTSPQSPVAPTQPPQEQPQAAFQQQPLTPAANYQQPVSPVGVPAQDPGSTLAIISLVCIIIFPLLGLVLALIARSQSKKVGIDNTMAKVSIIINAILVGLGILAIIFYLFLIVVAVSG